MTRPIPVRLADLLALFVPLVMATPVAIIGAALLILGGIFHHKKPAP